MMKLTSPLVATTLFVLATITGCSLAPKADPSQFFVLNPMMENQASASATELDVALGLGPIRIPEYLRRPQMVTRVGPNQVTYAEYDRWAQPLEASFIRVLREDLSGLFGVVDIAIHPWFSTAQLDFTVEIEVERFERDPSGAAQLRCMWVIKDGTSGERLDGGQFNQSQPADSATAGASVAAQSRLLGELSREIATAIKRVAAR